MKAPLVQGKAEGRGVSEVASMASASPQATDCKPSKAMQRQRHGQAEAWAEAWRVGKGRLTGRQGKAQAAAHQRHCNSHRIHVVRRSRFFPHRETEGE